MQSETSAIDTDTLIYLRELAKIYPNADAALAKIAALRAALTLPKETIHVISDIHGEFKKLKHVVNNASGTLRLRVDETFGDGLAEADKMQLLNLIYYPRETFESLSVSSRGNEARAGFVRRIMRLEFELLRELACHCRMETVEAVLPHNYKNLFREMIFAPQLGRSENYVESIIDEFLSHGKELDLLRMAARLVRNLLVSELVVAGDLGDRGQRIDRVIDYLIRQPKVSITWGNHDAPWMAACLGHEACIATVLRVSLRYSRVAQLEEGYGVSLIPLELLARNVYGEDPVERFHCKGEGLRDSQLMARMQKAMAIIQFKLEGQMISRNPQWRLEHRNLLHRIDPGSWTVEIDGKRYSMLDNRLPTIDWKDPYRLSPEEETCMRMLRQNFLQSPILWQHMQFVMKKGAMYLRRDHTLIFHACVPVDGRGEFLGLEVDGRELKGRALFDGLAGVVQRAFRKPETKDLDLFWYLWAGPLSPWFGKDKMATFETYFVADKETHKETKNPYFKFIHERDFCMRILEEFGMRSEDGLIVNGHVPVKIEQGESPLKSSGHAVTIDGAFSEAYGDKGYTLVLDASRTYIAQHHHFESVKDAITSGADIVPTIQDVRTFPKPRLISDTENGDLIRRRIQALENLIGAYRSYKISES